ncbi:serine/threonine protein kinase [Streptomyces cinnamoneus]|uniref:Serine/threonine protein kinase n=1 Tax=Streptomyces cinnamoneus TaxID=53446 RepID=A0A2G1XI71_STRCJ|nr:serine/threonine-protein kinase [Streptomyces cinnamoneus]PHQ50948.1 serine/threonine protein kinase [Streptomyces cinnamoneus]PPT13831.1 serine/threonine protein kinase [Streptomyces cinnamoneus]
MQPLLAEDPQVIGVYRLLGRLGAGGMGRVYLGRSAGGRTVAVKVVHPHFALDEQFRARFRREVQAARRVGGAWTAPVLDADPDAAVPWVATGYVAGPSLTQAVAETGPLPRATVRVLGAGLAEALLAVHGLGLVHRDVKPSNVLLALDGPRLIDFGIARASDSTSSLTSTGVSVGSPGYMAPEQILGKPVTGAADVFSLGAVLTFAATGVPPFSGDSSAALLYKVVHEEPELGPALTGELRTLVAHCLAKSPEARPAPEALARALAPAESGSVRGRVRSGWLPGQLVERVSRQAVALLDLEGTVADAGPGAPSGLIPLPGQAPPVSSGAASVPGGAGRPAVSGSSRAGDGRVEGPAGPDPTGPDAGRRVALEATATAGTARRRRLSCTLVVSVAGALAAATTAAFVFGLLPGTGGGGEETAKPPSGSQPGPSSPPATGSAVPQAFLGTWTGEVVQSDGTPNGTMTSVITAGGKDDYVVRTTYAALSLKCRSKAKLSSADAKTITLQEVADGPQGAFCTGATAYVAYVLSANGTLAFASVDSAGGKPHAILTRTG